MNPTTGMRIVRTRFIPRAPTDRLLADLAHLHVMYHTPEGLHAFDAPRRALVDNGIKIGRIRDELRQRYIDIDIDCRFCNA